MPRRRNMRKMVAPPNFKGLRPYGVTEIAGRIELLYEEYEAIKLADYDLMNHLEASKLMGVSRATFARIYESARRKIAAALVEVKEIITVYGNVHFDENWFICAKCEARFTFPFQNKNNKCPLCKSTEVLTIKKNEL